jgi:hypothetical protein
MCRKIKPLFNFEPPATGAEIREASLQFARKVSGFGKPSKANEIAFLAAVDAIAAASSQLLESLETNAPPRDRTVEAARAHARAARRFASRTGCLLSTNPYWNSGTNSHSSPFALKSPTHYKLCSQWLAHFPGWLFHFRKDDL